MSHVERRICVFCLRVPATHLHHLRPGLGGRRGPRVPLCATCHRRIHDRGLAREVAEQLARRAREFGWLEEA